jgi:hypothetical protein
MMRDERPSDSNECANVDVLIECHDLIVTPAKK